MKHHSEDSFFLIPKGHSEDFFIPKGRYSEIRNNDTSG